MSFDVPSLSFLCLCLCLLFYSLLIFFFFKFFDHCTLTLIFASFNNSTQPDRLKRRANGNVWMQFSGNDYRREWSHIWRFCMWLCGNLENLWQCNAVQSMLICVGKWEIEPFQTISMKEIRCIKWQKWFRSNEWENWWKEMKTITMKILCLENLYRDCFESNIFKYLQIFCQINS
jgi:hypothetical protein